MSIKKSLIIGFGTTILVSLAIIIASLVMMSSQKAAYQDIIDHYVEANQRASECRIDYNIAARGLRDAVLSGDMSNLDTATTKMTALEAAITELNASFPLDDQTQLNTFINTMKEWGVEAQEIIKVARTDRESARVMIVEQCSPKLLPRRAISWPLSFRTSRRRLFSSRTLSPPLVSLLFWA
jgi:methyl-accepting chemotaxis protein